MSNDDFSKTDIIEDDISKYMGMSSSEFDERMMSFYQRLMGKKFNSFSIDDAVKMANFETEVRIRIFKQFAEKDLEKKFNKWFEAHKKSIFQTIIQEMRQGKNEMTQQLTSESEVGVSLIRPLRNGYEPMEKSFKKVALGLVENVVENDPGLSPDECIQKFTEFVESKIKGVEVSEIKFKELWGDVYMDLTLSW